MDISRRRILTSVLIVGAIALVLLVTFSLNKHEKELSDAESIANANAEVKKDLVREIRSFKLRKNENDDARGAPLPPRKTRVPPEITKFHVPSTMPDCYAVVGVVPVLRKEQYSANTSLEDSGIQIEQENRKWLNSQDSIDQVIEQAGERNRTCSWIQISQPMGLDLVQRELSEYDATVLGSSGDLVRLQVPNDKDSLNSIRDLPWVNGIGSVPPKQRLSRSFKEEISNAVAGTEFPVFVTVMDSKQESVFRKSLENLGISVGHFDPSIRVFATVIEPSHVHDLTRLDFVQSVEPIPIVTAMHDTAVPALGVDKMRTIGSLPGTFSGFTGTSTPIAVMDTGLNTNHVDISTFRESICAKNFVENEDSDLFFDANGHGTHVTGTVAGNGFYVPKYAGMAPGVQDIRFAKVLNSNSRGTSLDILQGMDYLAEESSCVFDGKETEKVRPLIVNMSLSSVRLDHDSRSAAARKLDSTVWTHRQLYVVANANSNQYGYSNYGAAKNSLPVGASYDSGEIHGFSSHGPTVDNRLTPLVSATGVWLYSAAGWGNYDNYSRSSGTSMSSPSVAGLAALLMDASTDHKEQPALLRARFMASAVKPDSWFETESQFPRNNTNGPGIVQAKYGMGMVSSTTTILNNNSEKGWTSSGAAVEMENEQYAYHDIDVPEGTSRLDVVMTWDEPATDAIANNVLNDLNLWVDLGADCGSGPCGEYSSLSTIDNVEWVIISNPEAGSYRIKIDAKSVYSDAPRAAVAWTIIRGDSAPQLTVEASQDVYETPIGEEHYHNVDLTVSTDSFVAKGVSLHIDCRTLDGAACALGRLNYTNRFIEREHSALIQRSDGLGVAQVGSQFVLGEITEGNPTNVLLELYAQSSEPMRVYVKAMAWNG